MLMKLRPTRGLNQHVVELVLASRKPDDLVDKVTGEGATEASVLHRDDLMMNYDDGAR